ncbi:MAG: D-2-hydroxyacid dehydrogenase [Bryobacteraceae bacterium]|jgi:phosphoglycerate dehydrogenase-like enzyme
MDNIALLVLSDPTDRQLGMLEQLPEGTSLAVGTAPEAFERLAADAAAILNWSGPSGCLKEVLPLCPRVRWVHTRSAGLDDVLFPELVERPLVLTNGNGVFSDSLGEFALGAILFFAKGFRRLVRSQEAGRWDSLEVRDIAGQTAGIVGYGSIGRAVAARLRALGMKVLALRRGGGPEAQPDEWVQRVYGPRERLEMIAQCDYIVVSAPLTAATRGMIGEAEFAAMKPEAVVINIGRGPVIDEPAMLRALGAGRIQGAALDVFDTEPLPPGHALYGLGNVLLSPHTADHTRDWLDRAMQLFLDNFERFRKDEPLRNVVDKRRGY